MESFLADSQPVVLLPRPIWHTLWQRRKSLLYSSLSGFGLGLALALILPVQYTSTIALLPELQPNQAVNMQPFKELAESIGLTIDEKLQLEAIRPDLYPHILGSTPFALAVMHQLVTPKDQKPLTLYDFLAQTSWPFSIDSLESLPLPTAKPIRLSKTQSDLVEAFKSSIRADLRAKTGIMHIAAQMPDPEVAAQVAQFTADYLQAFVRTYRTDKARENEQFALRQLQLAQQEAHRLEQAMLSNQDQTLYISLPSASLPNRRFSEQYNAAAEVYRDLKREHTKARIQLQASTPVFKILEPAQVPDRRSFPKRTLFALVGIVSGFVLCGLFWVMRGIFVVA